MSRKIALVIGWGGVKCAAVLGLLRVLTREGIGVDMVVAGGGGSIFGSFIALGHNVEEIITLNQRLWTREITEQINPLATLQIALPRFFRRGDYFNLRADQQMNERLLKALGERTFADTKIPLFVTTTDYRTGKQVVLSTGRLFDAVRASIALPLIFPPVERDGQLLTDGYLSDPLPVGVAMQEQADIILAMGFESISIKARESFSDYILHLSGVIANNLLQASYAFYNLAHHSEVLLIVPQFKSEIHLFDTHKMPEIIQAGEAEGNKILPQLKHMLERTQ